MSRDVMDNAPVTSNRWQTTGSFGRISQFGARCLIGRLIRLLSLMSFLMVILSPETLAQSLELNRVVLEDTVTMDAITPHLSYYLDADWQKEFFDMVGADTDLFSPLESSAISFGYTRSKVWLKFVARNLDGSHHDWLLHFRENFIQIVDVYVVGADGEPQNVLSLQRDSPFSNRPVAYPELVVPLTLNPGEDATILISYWSEGYSGLEFSVETVERFAEISARRTAKNYIYYGMMIIAALIPNSRHTFFHKI